MGQDCIRKWAFILPVVSIILHIACLAKTGWPGVASYKDLHLVLIWMGFFCEIVTLVASCVISCEKDTNRKQHTTTCSETFTAFLAALSAIFWIFDLITILLRSQETDDIGLMETVAIIDIFLDISFSIMVTKLRSRSCCCDDNEIPFRRLN